MDAKGGLAKRIRYHLWLHDDTEYASLDSSAHTDRPRIQRDVDPAHTRVLNLNGLFGGSLQIIFFGCFQWKIDPQSKAF